MLVLTLTLARCSSWLSGPRCPSSWPAWTTGQCGGSLMQFLDKVFSLPVVVLRVSLSRQCFTQFWRLRSCSSSRSSMTLHAVSLSLSAGPCCQASCTAWAIPGSAVPGQVLLARRCASPGAGFCLYMLAAPLLEVSFVLRLLCCCCFSVLSALFLGLAQFSRTQRFRADPVLVSLLNGESVLYYAVVILLFTSLEKHIDALHRPF